MDVETGRVRWRTALAINHGQPAGSRVVVSDGVIVTGGHDLVGLEAGSGRHLWTFALDAGYGFGFYLGDRGEGTVFTGSATGRVYSVATGSGTAAWATALGGPSTTVYAPVAAGADVAVAFTDFEDPLKSGVALLDSETGRERWRQRLPVAEDGRRRPAVAGGPVFAGNVVVVTGHDGVVYAFARDDGTKAWSLSASATTNGDPDFRPLVFSAGTLVVGSLSGEVVAYDLTTRRERWRRVPVHASIAFEMAGAGQTLYVPYVSGDLVELSLADGTMVRRLGGSRSGFRWSPRVAEARVYVAGATGFLSFER